MYKVGIIGTGLMSEIYADILVQNRLGKLVAIAGNTKEKTDLFASKYNIKSFPLSRYNEMFSQHELDVVIIATPEWVREEPIEACLNNNVHIILEKPFADNIHTASVLYEKLRSYEKSLRVCHVLRFSPRFFMAKQHLLNKNIIHMDSSRNSNAERFKRISGHTNPCFWLAPHDIDMMLWLKETKVKKVFATSNDNNSPKDLLSVMVKFEDNSTATFRNIWGFNPVSNISRSAYFNIWHENGCIEINDSDMNIKIFENNEVYQPDTYEDFHIQQKRMGFFRNMLESFFDDFMNHSTASYSDLENAYHVTQVSEMISQSITKNKVISIEEI